MWRAPFPQQRVSLCSSLEPITSVWRPIRRGHLDISYSRRATIAFARGMFIRRAPSARLSSWPYHPQRKRGSSEFLGEYPLDDTISHQTSIQTSKRRRQKIRLTRCAQRVNWVLYKLIRINRDQTVTYQFGNPIKANRTNVPISQIHCKDILSLDNEDTNQLSNTSRRIFQVLDTFPDDVQTFLA